MEFCAGLYLFWCVVEFTFRKSLPCKVMIKYREVHIRWLRCEVSILRFDFILEAVDLPLDKAGNISEWNFGIFCIFMTFNDRIYFDDMRSPISQTSFWFVYCEMHCAFRQPLYQTAVLISLQVSFLFKCGAAPSIQFLLYPTLPKSTYSHIAD